MKRYLNYYKFFFILLFLSFTFICSVFLLLPQKTQVQSEIPLKDIIIDELNDLKYFPFNGEDLIFDHRTEITVPKLQTDLLLIELKNIKTINDILKDENNNSKSELFIDTMANSFYLEDQILYFKFTLFVDTDINLINFAYSNLLTAGIKNLKKALLNRAKIIDRSNNEAKIAIESLNSQINILDKQLKKLDVLRENNRISENFYYENYFDIDNDINFYNQKILALENRLLLNYKTISDNSFHIQNHSFNPENYPTLSTYSFEKKSTVLFYTSLFSILISILLILLYDLIKRDFKS